MQVVSMNPIELTQPAVLPDAFKPLNPSGNASGDAPASAAMPVDCFSPGESTSNPIEAYQAAIQELAAGPSTGNLSGPASSVVALSDPAVRRDGTVSKLTNYQQSGRVRIHGDTVTLDVGKGKTATYSLSQLATHSKDPEYFDATMRYAAKHGDAVKIDVHNGVARVTDPTLEHRLPQSFPHRDAIMRASVKHDVDPKLLGAVGMNESLMGKLLNKYGRGDEDRVSPKGHGYGIWQLDDQRRPDPKTGVVATGRPQALLDRVARDPYFAVDYAARMLAASLQKTKAMSKKPDDNVIAALRDYNSGDPTYAGTPHAWPDGELGYAESALRYESNIPDSK